MAKKKVSGLPLLDAMGMFATMLENHRTMRAARENLAEAFNSVNMNRDASMDDPWTLRTLCSQLTTNESEKLILFDRAMKENPVAALNLLKYSYYGRGKGDAESKIALNVLMDKPDELFELIENGRTFERDRLNKFWDLHNEYWFKKHNLAPVKLELLCRTFRHRITYDHLALMVKRYVGRKMDDHARRLQQDVEMNLPPDLIDQLEGCIMMKTLMKSNK